MKILLFSQLYIPAIILQLHILCIQYASVYYF